MFQTFRPGPLFRVSLLLTVVLTHLIAKLTAQSAWTTSRTNLPDVTGAVAVAYGNGRFVVTLAANASGPAAAWSTDGLTWNASQLLFPQSGSIVFAAGAFYLAGGSGIYRSTDGNSWQQIYTSSNPRSLGKIFSDGRSLLTGPGYISGVPHTMIYSADRVTFRETAPLPDSGASFANTFLERIAWVNGRYFVKTFAVLPNGNARDYYYSTTDGTTWTAVSGLAAIGPTYLTSGNGRLVGDGFVSTDGVNFIRIAYPNDAFNGGKMGFAGGKYFFLGGFYASTDGLIWARIATPPASSTSRQMESIAYGNGRFVAVGADAIFTPTFSQFEVIATVAASAPPVIGSTPLDRTAVEGTSTTFSVTVENPGTNLTYQWRRDGVAISGATNASYAIAAVRPSDAALYSVVLTNTLGTTTSDPAQLTVAPPTVAPTVGAAPVSTTIVAGGSATFSVTINGTAPFTYQWLRDGTPIAGANANTLTLNSALLAQAGAYSVTVSNPAGSVTSSAATLTVTAVSRLSNLSVLTTIAAPGDNFTLGYVVSGLPASGSKPLVLRAAGPSLGALGVAGTLDDPKLELFAGSSKIFENDNWGTANLNGDGHAAVGAFPFFSLTSKDAAVTFNVTSRDNSMKVSATGSGTGLVLAEIYDATPPAAFTQSTPRLANVSVLKPLGTGFTVGFTIAGAASKSVLIRAIGPALGNFGVSGAVTDPRLTLFNAASAKLDENDDWGGTASLAMAFSSVGAFALPADSKDAALVAALQPGSYTVQVSGVGGTTGIALVEVYEVP